MTSLDCKFGPLSLPHPVLAASGCFAYGQQFAAFMDLRELAGLSTKGISPLPRPGNPLPRICETEAGFLNSIGLENRGVEAYQRDVLPQMARAGMILNVLLVPVLVGLLILLGPMVFDIQGGVVPPWAAK